MSTVRVYKVAELLNTTSQEVGTLLKKLGIDVKSASSTIEEVVARQLVERADAAMYRDKGRKAHGLRLVASASGALEAARPVRA